MHPTQTQFSDYKLYSGITKAEKDEFNFANTFTELALKESAPVNTLDSDQTSIKMIGSDLRKSHDSHTSYLKPIINNPN